MECSSVRSSHREVSEEQQRAGEDARADAQPADEGMLRSPAPCAVAAVGNPKAHNIHCPYFPAREGRKICRSCGLWRRTVAPMTVCCAIVEMLPRSTPTAVRQGAGLGGWCAIIGGQSPAECSFVLFTIFVPQVGPLAPEFQPEVLNP